MKLESTSEGKPESNPHANSENKIPESSNANSGNGGPTNPKATAANSAQQAEMKLPSEANKEENSTPTTE